MKSKTTAWLLAIFLWGLGVHKFYLGESGQGFFYLIFCWTFIPAIFGLFEGISYFSHDQERWDNKYNDGKDVTGRDYYDQLLKFEQLREKGLIDQKEYERKVAELKEKIEKSENRKKQELQEIERIKEKNRKLNKILKRILFWVLGIILVRMAFVFLLIFLLWDSKDHKKSESVMNSSIGTTWNLFGENWWNVAWL